MRRDLPPIHESADVLKQQFHAERHPHKRQRLQMLYLFASRTAASRTAVARILGVGRNTIARWVETYRTSGLDGLLAVYIPAGRAPALTPDQVQQLRERLADPAGFASYAAIQAWVQTTFGVTMSINALQKLVCYQLKARPKVARPTHPKKTPPP